MLLGQIYPSRSTLLDHIRKQLIKRKYDDTEPNRMHIIHGPRLVLQYQLNSGVNCSPIPLLSKPLEKVLLDAWNNDDSRVDPPIFTFG